MMILIFGFTKIFVLLIYFMNNPRTSYQKQKMKPNVLFIIVDDLRPLPNEEINLNNIERLAGKSIRFKNAFAQQALCAPSRNSILTGRKPDSLRLYDFNNYWRNSIGNYKTIPELFKENGYKTYSVGKVFHPGISSNFTDDYPYSWSARPYHPQTERFKNAAVCQDKHTKKKQKNLICPVNIKVQPGKTLPDIETIEYAIDVLKNSSRNQPFLLAVGFHKPHIPLKYPKKYKDRFPIETIKPPQFPYMSDNLPIVSWHPWMDVRSRDDIQRLNISFPFGIMPDKWTLKIKQSYYAASLYIDDLVGKLLSNVDKSNTIVVLTSDHGWSLGENGLWAKYSNFDTALKVPLIFSVPGISPQSIYSPVELVDIFPTLVELAALNVHVSKCSSIYDKSDLCYDGKSLVPFMSKNNEVDTHGYRGAYEYFAISQYPRPSQYPKHNSDKPRLKDIRIMGYSIRTIQYRYTEWVHFNSTTFTLNWNIVYGVELYNHMEDAYESNNLYNNFRYQHVKNYLSYLLRSNVSA